MHFLGGGLYWKLKYEKKNQASHFHSYLLKKMRVLYLRNFRIFFNAFLFLLPFLHNILSMDTSTYKRHTFHIALKTTEYAKRSRLKRRGCI